MRHETNYNSINLLYNGGWALADSDGIPAFWTIEGASREDDLSVYEVTPDGLQLELAGRANTTLSQSFTEAAGPLDFEGDLDPETYRGMPYGYVHAPARNLSAKDLWTVSFDLTLGVGACTVKVSALIAGATVYLTASTGGEEVRVADPQLIRPHFFLDEDSQYAIERITIEVTSDAPTEVFLDRIQMSLGQYADLPYTGDPFVQIFPENCIMLVLGGTCPAGFEELGDGDLEVPSEWSDQEPGIRPRKGNYPGKGTELMGAPTHGPSTVTSSTGSNLTEQFESRFGRAFAEPAVGPAEWIEPSTNPLVDQQLEHTHETNMSSSRVLAVEYLFCKRV